MVFSQLVMSAEVLFSVLLVLRVGILDKIGIFFYTGSQAKQFSS